MLTPEQAIENLIGQYRRVKIERDVRMTRVEQMRKYTFPHKSFLTQVMTPGSNAWSAIFDNMGQVAARDFAANLYTHTTPSDQTWFILTPPAAEPDLAGDRSYAQNLAAMTEHLHRAQAQTESHWATEIHSAFEDLADGTCCVEVVKESQEKAAPFVVTTLGMNEYAFLSDAAGRPHTVFNEANLTAYEAAERWGLEKLPTDLQESLKDARDKAYVDTQAYLNVMRPNKEWDARSISSRRFRYENLWIDLKTKKVLQRGGLRRLRRIVARFNVGRGLPWGFGPTDAAYGVIRGLDKAMEIWLKYGAMKMNPPSIWPDDGAYWPQDAAPGSVIVGRMGATDKGVPSFLEIQGDHRIGEFLVNYLAAAISRAYLADIFQVLQPSRSGEQPKAVQVAAALQKSYDSLVPPLARMKQELISPLILIQLELLTERELGVDGWMYGGQTLPDFKYDLQMISPLFLAMQYAQLQRLGDAFTILSPWGEVDASIWDNWTLDEISHVVQETLGIPNRLRRSASGLRDLRRARAELVARQQALEQAKLAAEATNKLSKGAEPNSPMGMAMEAA
jgi:hypothetical protein